MVIVFEGIDGSGKGTQVELLYNNIVNNNGKARVISITDLAKTGLEYFSKEEFNKYINNNNVYIKGINNVIENITNILSELNTNIENNKTNLLSFLYSKLFLYYVTLGKLITPIIESYSKDGYIVILDRWIWSSIAYNNINKGTIVNSILKDSTFTTESVKKTLNTILQDVLKPDLLLYIDLDSKVAMERITNRGSVVKVFESEDKLNKVLDCYRNLYKESIGTEDIDSYLYLYGKRTYLLDGNESIDKIHNSILDIYKAII